MEQPFYIRPIEEKDISGLATLHSACFTKDWGQKELRNLLDHGVIGFVATDDNATICGFVLARIVLDEAEIISIGVLPEKRKHGLAENMMRHLLAHEACVDVRALFIEVEAFNDAGKRLYEKLGFQRTGSRKGYYEIAGQRIDAITMTLTL